MSAAIDQAISDLNNARQILGAMLENMRDVIDCDNHERMALLLSKVFDALLPLRKDDEIIDMLASYIATEYDARSVLRADIKLRDELLAAMDEEKKGLLEENYRMAKTIARLEAIDTKNKQAMAEAQNTVEELVRDLAGLVDRSTDLFNRGRHVRLYDINRARPHSAAQHEPLISAGASV